MGLSREVMQRLLQGVPRPKTETPETGTPDDESDPLESPGHEDFEFEYDSDDGDPSNSPRSRAQAQRILSVKSPRRFRVRLMSQDNPARPNMGQLADQGWSSVPSESHLSSSAGERHLSRSWSEESSKHLHRITSSAAAIKAEYVFAGKLGIWPSHQWSAHRDAFRRPRRAPYPPGPSIAARTAREKRQSV